MSLTFESILKKVKTSTSTNKTILTENIIATHRSIVKNCNAVKKIRIRIQTQNRILHVIWFKNRIQEVVKLDKAIQMYNKGQQVL